ncbi:hypothetical protein IC582_013927 [Cucumis melo]
MYLSPNEIKEIYGTRLIGGDQARGLVGLMDFFCSMRFVSFPAPFQFYVMSFMNNQ